MGKKMKEKIRHLTWCKGEWTQKSTSLNKRIHTWFERLHRIFFPIILQHTPRFFVFFFVLLSFSLVFLCVIWFVIVLVHIGLDAITMTIWQKAFFYSITHILIHKWNIACRRWWVDKNIFLFIAFKIELIEYFKCARTWESEWHPQAIKWYFFLLILLCITMAKSHSGLFK